MADMSMKHFTLIQDAINQGCWDAINRICLGVDGIHAPVTTSRSALERIFALSLGNSFAARLAYTHDKFDADGFKRHLSLGRTCRPY